LPRTARSTASAVGTLSTTDRSSASTITNLKKVWEEEFEECREWNRHSLEGKEYVYGPRKPRAAEAALSV